MTSQPLRLALDQNFPLPLLAAVGPFLPAEVELIHLSHIHPPLGELSDRQLFIALASLGYQGLVTNNYRMLNIPEELAVIVATKAVVVATKALGHDPLRAAGALLLELPGLPSRLRPNVSNVFVLDFDRRRPKDAWSFLESAATHRGVSVTQRWAEVRPDADELSGSFLP